jgi:2-C-methyl-D-erythritol 4-phosphate cytidylyltransferase
MVTAILLAGGKGRRMASSKSKQYIELEGKPILYYTIKHFMNNDLIDDIILVLSEDEIDYCKDEVLKKYNLKINKIVSGGRERQESVYNGLIAANGADVVLIQMLQGLLYLKE